MKGKRLLSVLLAGCILSGCGTAAPEQPTGQSEGQSTEQADEQPAEQSKGEIETLTMLTYVDWYGDGLKAVEEYVNENSEELGFKLEIQQIPGGSEGDSLVSARSATNDLPDILNTYSVFKYNSLGGKGKMVPLDDCESIGEYDEEIINSTTYSDEGHVYGLPCGTGYYYGMYYNKKVLEEAGVGEAPSSWDELLAACEKVKNVGKIPMYYSAVDPWTCQIGFASAFNKDIEDFGLEPNAFWDEINTNKIKWSECKNALEYIGKAKDLIDRGYVQDTYLSDTYDMAQTALANGDCAFYICAHVVVSEIASKYPDKLEDIGGTIVPFFGEEEYHMNLATPTMLTVTTAASNPELAKKAVDFICSAKGQEIYAAAQPGVYINQKMDTDMPSAYKEQAEYSMYPNWNPKYVEGSEKFLVDCFVGSKTPEEVLSSMDEEFARGAEAAGDENW